jgi:hypothetical protein
MGKFNRFVCVKDVNFAASEIILQAKHKWEYCYALNEKRCQLQVDYESLSNI